MLGKLVDQFPPSCIKKIIKGFAQEAGCIDPTWNKINDPGLYRHILVYSRNFELNYFYCKKLTKAIGLYLNGMQTKISAPYSSTS